MQFRDTDVSEKSESKQSVIQVTPLWSPVERETKMSWEINKFAATVINNIASARETGNTLQFVIPQNSHNFGRCLQNFVDDSLTSISQESGRHIYNSMGRQRIIEPITGQNFEAEV